MVPEENLSVLNVVEQKWSTRSIEVVSDRRDPATNTEVLNLVVSLQSMPPQQLSVPADPPKISAEVGRVDYFI